MDCKRTFQNLAFGLLVLGTWTSAAHAAAPWANLLTSDRVEADPAKTYRLGEQNGPWMIVACSFSGEGAEEQARELALELRKRYKLPAYVHRMSFEFGTTEGRGIDQYGAPLEMRHRVDNLKEVAVLVGDYMSADDPDAQKTLQKLKYTTPQCLEADERKKTNQTLAGWRTAQRQLQEMIGSEKKEKGPMGHAFVTTNPVLPKEFFNSPGIDPLVLEMNQGVTHSLLDCPGKYTIQVATFKGNVFIKSGEIDAVEHGQKEIESKLVEAAEKAHVLTEALRLKGWEAYEFHDRYASIVTVGSFNTVGTPRADGRTEIDRQVYAIIQTFSGQPIAAPVLPGTLPTQVRSLMGIPFDVQAIPVEVPRRSISQEMAARR